MVVEMSVEVEDMISLEEFVQFVENQVDTSNLQGLLIAAEQLRRLANNREALSNFFLRRLQDCLNDNSGNRRTSRIFNLVDTENYTIRALIWEPVPPGVRGEQFFYNIAHDHDFDFITVNCFGPGYITDVYSYENSSVKGELGERVAIRSEGRKCLTKTTLLGFEAGKDIHTQFPPKELSISLNLAGKSRIAKSPFWFDTATQTIVDWVDHTENIEMLLLDSATRFPIPQVQEAVRRIALSHQNSKIRQVASQILSTSDQHTDD